MKINNILLFCFYLISGTTFSQHHITGKITDEKNEGLPGASILVKLVDSSKTISYAISDWDGNYLVPVKTDYDSIQIKVSFLGYISQIKITKNKDQKIDFKLKPSNEKLKEVTISAPRISKRGDTLNYRVSAFKKEEDRAIIDIIKRLPGIEVNKKGVIYYEGKPINKFYIENMDLLEGRYALASNNLPANQVASVQIYEKHQPIKILDSLVFSDRAALNIKLKKNFSYALPVEVSTGLSPMLYNGKITPMLFTKKQQALGVFEANNTGQFLEKNISNLSNIQSSSNKRTQYQWLNITDLSSPPVSEEKYLDNTSFLLSSNYLIQLKKDNVLKINVFFIQDKKEEQFSSQEQYFIGEDTIKNYLFVYNNHTYSQLHTQLIYEKNTKKRYLKNNFNYEWYGYNGNSTEENKALNQKIEYPLHSFTNIFNFSFPFKKQILSLQFYVNYVKDNQQLYISPGLYPDIFNENNPYKESVQNIDFEQWNAHTGFGLTKKIKRFTVENYYKLNFKYSFLKSDIGIFTPDYVPQTTPFLNDLSFLNFDLIDEFKFSYNRSRLNINLNVPLMLKNIKIKDKIYLQDKIEQNFVADYNSNFIYRLNKAKLIVSHGKKTRYGDISNNFKGYIWKNYNQLVAYDAPLLKNIKKDYSGKLFYKEILSGFNAGLGLRYEENKKNILYSIEVQNDALNISKAIQTENSSYSWQGNLSLSKYIAGIKTNLKGQFLYFSSNKPLLLNNKYTRFLSSMSSFTFKLDFPLTRHFSFYVDYNYTLWQNQIGADISIDKLSSDVFWYPFNNKNSRIKFSAEYSNIPLKQDDINLFFLNLEYRYIQKKRNREYFIKLNNVTNTEQYIDIYQSDFFYQKTVFNLRPFQILGGIKMSL